MHVHSHALTYSRLSTTVSTVISDTVCSLYSDAGFSAAAALAELAGQALQQPQSWAISLSEAVCRHRYQDSLAIMLQS